LPSKLRVLSAGLEDGSQSALIVRVNESTFANLNIGPKAFLRPQLHRCPAGILAADHRVDADATLRMQARIQRPMMAARCSGSSNGSTPRES
jgi:hypothetical protein